MLAIVSVVTGVLTGFLVTGGVAIATNTRGSGISPWIGLFYVALGVIPLGVQFASVLVSRRLRIEDGYCRECGYEVRGLLDRCPECGKLFATADAQPSSPAFFARTPVLFVAAVLATVPCYGYLFRASRDSHLVGLLIILCWVVTFPFTVGVNVRAIFRPALQASGPLSAALLNSYLLVSIVVGWGGAMFALQEMNR